MKSNTVLFLGIITLFICCQSPQKLYDKGNYTAALNQSLKRIKKGKAKREDIALAQKSMDKLDQGLIGEIDDLMATGDFENWEKAYKLYEKLISKRVEFDKLIRYDSPRRTELEEEQNYLRQDIIDVAIETGFDYLSDAQVNNDKLAAQDANYYFNKAASFNSDFADIDSLIDLSYDLGILIYAIEIDDPNVSIRDLDFHENYRSRNEFVKVVESSFCDACDCKIDIDLDFIDYNEDRRTVEEIFKEEVIDGYETVTDTSGKTEERPIYIDVQAQVITNLEIITARLDAEYRIKKMNSNCPLSGRDRFSVEVETQGKSHQVYGDQRAIPGNLDLRDQSLDSKSDLKRALYELLNETFERELEF